MDKQTVDLSFNAQKLKKLIILVEEKHKSDSKPIISEIWDKVTNRTCNSTVINRIKAEGSDFSTASVGFLLGNQTENIINYYRKL